MSKKAAASFAEYGIIAERDKDVYAYCFELLFATLFNLFAVVAVSAVSKTLRETTLYLLAFIPLRQVAGGYHAKNHSRCFVILMGVYGAFLLLLGNLGLWHMRVVIWICLPLSGLAIFILAPIDDPNKPISHEEKIMFGKRSRASVAIYASLAILLYFTLPGLVWSFAVVYGMMSVALSLCAKALTQAIGKR